jgi:hypothetical protein
MASRPDGEQFRDVSRHRDRPAPRLSFSSSAAVRSCVWVRVSTVEDGSNVDQPAPLGVEDESIRCDQRRPIASGEPPTDVDQLYA